MKAGLLKAAVQYVGGFVTAAFFVVLLTFIFSFLGTIFCAALAGMMLGAVRTLKWQSLPVSLLFPLVIFTLLRGMKADLPGGQVLLLSVICFSVFWGAYAGGATLLFYERKRPLPAGAQTGCPQAALGSPGTSSAAAPAAAPATAGPEFGGSLSLEALQGDWSGEACAEARFEKRRMSIHEEELTLCCADNAGHIRLLARGRLRINTLGATQTVLLTAPVDANGSDGVFSI